MKSINFHTWLSSGRWVSIGLTGAGLAFSFPPFPFALVACAALIPLLRRWYSGEHWRDIYLDFFYAFLILFAITFSWPLRHPFTNTAIASLSGVLLIPMTLALPFALALKIRKRLGAGWGLTACCTFFLTTEWFWAHGPIAMPGTLLGHALAEQRYVNQIVDITGVAGLSLWILTINIIGMLLLERFPASRKLKLAILLTVILSIAPVYSWWRMQFPFPETGSTITVVVQPAANSTDWSDESDVTKLYRMRSATDSLLALTPRTPELVIWPETTLPVLSSLDDSLVQSLRSWSGAGGFSLLAGAILATPSGNLNTAYSNSAILLNGNRDAQRYDKNWLVPFAEHVPFESTVDALSFFRVDAGGVAGYQPGNAQPLMQLPAASFGVLICFETLFGDYTRRYAASGASFLAAVSNIGWWGEYPAPAQYMAFSKLRAIESRRSLVIGTVTGPSVVIDPFGSVIEQAPWMSPEMIFVDIPHATVQTFYTKYGDWLSLLSILVSLLIFARYALENFRTTAHR